MWVPLVENREYDSPGADYFVEKYVEELFAEEPEIDTIILGCTHYPLLIEKIRRQVAGRATMSLRANSWPQVCATISSVTQRWTRSVPVEALAPTSPPRMPDVSPRLPGLFSRHLFRLPT